MGEIWIPELIIVLFFLFFLLRPVFKSLLALDGLVWLSFIGFILTLCLFPAYGFRPECIPLLVFGFLLNIVNIPQLAESVASRGEAGGGMISNESEHGLILPLVEFIVFIAVLIPMFVFSPKIPLGLTNDGVQTRTINDVSLKNDYFLRIYLPRTDESRPRPLVFLAPPEAGSVSAVDRVCTGLRDQGFIVISYSRRGLDFPAVRDGRKYYVSLSRINAMWQAFRKGTESNKANTWGRFLESERQKDIEFLLPLICGNRDENGAALLPALSFSGTEEPVFFIGYGAAGSAAAFLFEQPGFSARFKNVKGLALIESRLWSSYQEDPLLNMEPRWLPQPDSAVLYLVSDRIFAPAAAASPDSTGNPYRAVLAAFTHTARPAALAAFEGSGPFAYGDYPLTHPLYSFLFPGLNKKSRKSHTPVDDTSGYTGNFFLMLLQQAPDDIYTYNSFIMPEKRVIVSPVLVERRGLPAF